MKKSIIIWCMFFSLTFGVFANSNSEKTDKSGFKRDETIYVTGGMWMTPENFNPINWSVVAGVRGLVYESLFYWSPLTNEFEPWLAQSFAWVDDGKTLEVKMTEGVTFNNGEPVTIEDIAFSFSYEGWSNPYGAESVEIVDETTVRVKWTDPSYHSILTQLYTWPVINKAFWSEVPPSTATEITISLEESIGTGPYTIESYQQDRVVFLRDDNWWGKKGKGMEFPAKRIVYFKSLANNVVMGLLDKGELDMANNFIPGTPQAKKNNKNIVTWHQEAPYHYPDNIVYLFPNHTRAPYSDVEFRRAMAYAINPEEIADVAFEDMVTPRYNSLGLHNTPAWEPYVNEDIAKEYGFDFDENEAKRILDDAGYLDVDGDGFRDYPDGSPLEIKCAVPMGWTDFMDATRIIADNMEAVGINMTPEFPDEGKYQTDMVNGDFDMVINNWNSYQSPSPFSLYQWLGSTLEEIGQADWTGNFGRYDNPELIELVTAFGQTPYENIEEGNEIVREIQKILLTELPQIPLWVNGMWFAANNEVWTDWPSEDGTNPNYPSLFSDKLQVGGLRMLQGVTLNKSEE